MITSVYSKRSNSSGFNSVLQKFYEMICQIIVSKTVCGIFLIFVRLRFISNFIVKVNFRNRNHQKNVEVHLLSKSFHTQFWRFYLQKSAGRIFFKKNFCQGLGSFFKNAKLLTWRSLLLYQKQFYTFFNCNYIFNLNTILTICFKNVFRKIKKKWCFYSFK